MELLDKALPFISIGTLVVVVVTLFIAARTWRTVRRVLALSERRIRFLQEEQERLAFLREERQSLLEELRRERQGRPDAAQQYVGRSKRGDLPTDEEQRGQERRPEGDRVDAQQEADGVLPAHGGAEKEEEDEEISRDGFSLNLVRWGSIAFVLAGVVRLILGFLVVEHLEAGAGPILVLLVIALLLVAVGLVGLHTLQKDSYGLIGWVGFYTVLVAVAARIWATGGLLLSGILLSGGELYAQLVSVGFWSVAVGLVLYGAATIQARVLPRWYGALLVIFMPLAKVFGEDIGSIWEGIVLLLLGYALWLQRGHQPNVNVWKVVGSFFHCL